MLLELLEAPFDNIRIVSGDLRVLRVTAGVAGWFLGVFGWFWFAVRGVGSVFFWLLCFALFLGAWSFVLWFVFECG